VLGEAAKDLSGGQRQRIAIARAILRQAPIVILDEATAGLDPASRDSVLQALAALTRERTSITITHDAHSARSCDRIVWLENGSIVEEGRPEDLLRDPGSRFARWMDDRGPPPARREAGSAMTGAESAFRDPDLSLASRDRDALPGLPYLLDDGRLSSLLGETVRVTRVRYKPRTSLLVAFRRIRNGSFDLRLGHDPDPCQQRQAPRRGTGLAATAGHPGPPARSAAGDNLVAVGGVEDDWALLQ
jgi:ABC-type glutathione transport system ATPase component